MLRRILAAMMVVSLALPDAAALAGEAAARTSVVRVTSPTPSKPVQVATSVYREEPTRRPAILPALYAGLGVLQALDTYTTAAAVRNGSREANPIMAPIAGNVTAMLAVKAVSTTVSIYCAERLWKKNRLTAVAVMVGVNVATAAVVANNMNNARARR